MKRDVIEWTRGNATGKLLSKETLNHRGLIEMISGLDGYEATAQAYLRTYEAVGIDIINRVPFSNAPEPTPEGSTTKHPTKPYHYGHLGVYDTLMRHTYPCRTREDVWNLDVGALSYEDHPDR